MRFRRKTILVGLSVLLVVSWLVFTSGGRSLAAKLGQECLHALLGSFGHSMALHGIVVDQFGKPVPDATVRLFVYSGFLVENSSKEVALKTDARGRFSASGLRGRGLGVSVMKGGYLRIPALGPISSSVSLSYAGGSGDRHADPSNPLVLNLIKVGPVEPMTHVPKKRWKLPLDGTLHPIALDSEDGQGLHQIQFRFFSDRNTLPMDNERNSKMFNWSLELQVPGGGLAWDESDAKFEAPVSGYKEVVRFEYPATTPPGDWKRWRVGRYFVMFADGTYGRIQFSIDGTSDRRPLYMESWLCLTPGSRNLATEYMIINVMESKDPDR